MTCCAIYSRVSTLDKQDVSMQADELREYCRRFGLEATEYQDEGVSGSKASRPSLNRMLADARAGRFQVLIVWRLDRLFRSMVDCITTLDELARLGVRFVALKEGLDIDPSNPSPVVRLQMQMLAAFAEFERSLIVERVRAGVAHARAKGQTLGRPRVIVDAAKIADMRSAGKSWAEVSRAVCQTVPACRRAHARYVAALPKSVPVEGGFSVGSAVV